MMGAGIIMTGLLVLVVAAAALIRALSVLHHSDPEGSDPLQEWDLHWGDI